MAARSSRKEHVLPSLLDRITDDQHIRRTLSRHKSRIQELERQISSQLKAAEETEVKKWFEELEAQRSQYDYLMRSSGALDKLGDCVKRDLSWLFNTQNMCRDEELEEEYPGVAISVLNFGLPDLTGKTASSINIPELEQTLKQTILRFEPRIIPRTLKVQLHADKTMMDHNALVFDIRADLCNEPLPIHLHFLTQLDLESGDAEVSDA